MFRFESIGQLGAYALICGPPETTKKDVKNQSSRSRGAQYWYVTHTEIEGVTAKVTRSGLSDNHTSSVSDIITMAWPRSRINGMLWHLSENVLTITTSLLIPILTSCQRGMSHGKLVKLVKSVQHMLSVLDEVEDEVSSEQGFVKYHNAVLKQKMFKDSEPPPKKPACNKPLYQGWLKHYLALKLKANHRLRSDTLSLILSLYESKDKWPSPSDRVLEEAFSDHRVNICGQTHVTDPAVLKVVRSVSRRVLGGNLPERASKYLPTGHGCNQASRAKSGTGSCIKKVFKLKPSDNQSTSDGTDLARMLNTRPEKTIFPQVEEWKQLNYEHNVSQVTKKFLNHDESLYATRVVAIPEASKFRIISLMDGDLANALQPAQGQLLSAWKQFPGNTMTHPVEELVLRLVTETAHEPDMDSFVSGDYKGATDTLHKDASDASLDPLLPNLIDPNIAALSFLPSYVEYPVFKDGTRQTELVDGKTKYCKEVHKQTNGQLMGQSLSFPLLCVINFACLVSALQVWIRDKTNMIYTSTRQGRRVVVHMSRSTRLAYASTHSTHIWEFQRVQLEDTPEMAAYLKVRRIAKLIEETVIVNGDDILFKCPTDFYPYWKAAVAAVGFKLSLGKNYVSKDVLQVNSQVFTYRNGKVTRHGYLNQKLLFGENPDNLKIDHDLLWDPLTGAYRVMTPMGLCRELNSMYEICPLGRSLIPTALKRWSSDWIRNEESFTPNWYLPVPLGGYGLRPQWAEGRPIHYTHEQLKVASTFVANPDSSLYRLVKDKNRRTAGAGASLEALFKGRLAKHWALEPVGPGGEDVVLGLLEDEWMLRLTLIDQISMVGTRIDAYAPPVLRKKDPKRWRDAKSAPPMPRSEIHKYWNVKYTTGALPPCVPFKPITPLFHLTPAARRAASKNPDSVDVSVAGMARRWSLLA